jgi:putative hydrolase of the HAD superfamily
VSSIKAVLFDADGVIQRPAVEYRVAFAALSGLRGKELNRFVGEIFAAERPSLRGQRDFVKDLLDVLVRWDLSDRLEDVLGIWTAIEADPTIFTLIAALRSLGVRCCLATNQQAHRGSYMSETLGYCDQFDFQFYSYQLGSAKPAFDYFRTIAKVLDVHPSNLLFIDDHEPNVIAARTVGIYASLFGAGPAAADRLLAILREHGLHPR